MNMKAITNDYNAKEADVTAIRSGIDIILQVKIKRGLILEDTDLIIREETIK